MKAVIIEDETISNHFIKKIMENYHPEIEIVQQLFNVEDSIDFLEKNEVDLILTDIQLGNQTCFEIFKKIKHYKFKIIFITAYEDYAINAIKCGALDYMIKPLVVKEFNKTIEEFKLLNPGSEPELKERINITENAYHTSASQTLCINTHERVYFVKLTDITHLEAQRNYTIIYTVENETIVSSKNLGFYEKLLNEDFIRIHHKFIVNKQAIKEINKQKMLVVFNNDATANISRRLFSNLFS